MKVYFSRLLKYMFSRIKQSQSNNLFPENLQELGGIRKLKQFVNEFAAQLIWLTLSNKSIGLGNICNCNVSACRS